MVQSPPSLSSFYQIYAIFRYKRHPMVRIIFELDQSTKCQIQISLVPIYLSNVDLSISAVNLDIRNRVTAQRQYPLDQDFQHWA